MLHDGPEAKIGDIPSPVKKFIGVTEIARMERTVCDWYEAEVRKPSAAEYSIVHIADSIEALSWISRYGSGFRDRFDGHDIEDGLRKRVHIEALSSPIEGLAAAVQSVLGEVAT
jgi:5'-deoxynucleotidase YfbR-like HD superfamily hydrolase